LIVPIDDRARVEMKLRLLGFTATTRHGDAIRFVSRTGCVIDLRPDHLQLIYGPSTILDLLDIGYGRAVTQTEG
jgi:hypothetical protein